MADARPSARTELFAGKYEKLLGWRNALLRVHFLFDRCDGFDRIRGDGC